MAALSWGIGIRRVGERPTYWRTRSVLVRGLGLAYVAAFGSLAVQVDGLIGRRGILPAAEFLERAAAAIGRERYWQIPTLLWLNASDPMIRGLCWGGVVLGALVALGVVPRVGLALGWLFYLSLTSAGQDFLAYQWDSLLLEAGLLGVLIAPRGVWLARAAEPPPVAVVWLFRWLVFRLMFLSGVVKLTSGDPTWRAWEAMRYHYETQPLPTWTSWYVHQCPAWFHTASVGVMFWAELIAPFLIVGPRAARRLAFVSMVGLMLVIAATGNYGFFNGLSVILCGSLLDDRDLRADPAVGRRNGPRRAGVLRWGRGVAFWGVVAVIAGVTAMETAQRVRGSVRFPWPLETVRAMVEPLRSTNTYGLFAWMTTERPEITLEGSDDGKTWRPYRFRWKPGEVDRRPRFTFPHLPRLDWQMWFAALAGRCDAEGWFLRFERRLFEGSPEVVALLREDPFPARPPRYLRARLELYRFTRPGDRAWWSRADRGWFCPPLEAPEPPRPGNGSGAGRRLSDGPPRGVFIPDGVSGDGR